MKWRTIRNKPVIDPEDKMQSVLVLGCDPNVTPIPGFSHFYEFVFYSYVEKGWRDVNGDRTTCTHWMYLPKPPKR